RRGEHPALHRRETGHNVDERHEHDQRDEDELDQRRAALTAAQPLAEAAHAASFTARPVTSSGSRLPSEARSAGTDPEQRTTTRVSPLGSTSSPDVQDNPSAVCTEVARATTSTARAAPTVESTSAFAAYRPPSCALAVTTSRTCT